MEIMEVTLHSERVSIWCAVMQGRISGPYFLENEEEKAITVKGERYHSKLTDFFIPQVDDRDQADIHF